MANPDPAAARFWMIQLSRLGAFLLAFFGALIVGKVVEAPAFVGYILLVLGAVEYFLIPHLLAKKWKTPEQ